MDYKYEDLAKGYYYYDGSWHTWGYNNFPADPVGTTSWTGRSYACASPSADGAGLVGIQPNRAITTHYPSDGTTLYNTPIVALKSDFSIMIEP